MPRKRSPLAPQRAPQRRHRVIAAQGERREAPLIDEKQELILAHAERRAFQDPMQRLAVWVGTLTTFAVLLIVWWFIRPASLLTRSKDGGSILLREETGRLSARANDELQDAARRVEELRDRLAQDARALDRTAHYVNSRKDLFRLTNATATTGTTTSTSPP